MAVIIVAAVIATAMLWLLVLFRHFDAFSKCPTQRSSDRGGHYRCLAYYTLLHYV